MALLDQLRREPTPECLLALEEIADILSSHRRVTLLEYVAAKREKGELPTQISDAADVIATEENGARYTSAERKRVYVGLYQAHLPSLDELDVLTFNPPGGEIDVGPEFDAVLHAIEQLDEIADRRRTVDEERSNARKIEADA